MQGMMALLTGFFLLSYMFESLLRWLLDIAHLSALIYARDVAMVMAIMLGYIDIIANRRSVLVPFAALALLLAGSVIGLLSGLSLLQVAFGVKIWLPLLLGFLLVNSLHDDGGALSLLDRPRFWLGVWGVLVLGIIINKFFMYPWTGLLVQVGNVSVTANREWSAAGIMRLSGFSRTSFDAATFILLLAFYLVVSQRSFVQRCMLWLLSGIAIVLTTTKGATGTYLAATLLLPMVLTIRADQLWTLRRALAIAAICSVALVGLLAPLIASQIPFPVLRVGTPEHFVFSSFVARAWSTWPSALALLDGWQHVLGRGIGGIGAAQNYFESWRYSPADNFFVYCYVTAGIIGAGFYIHVAAQAWRLPLHSRGARLCFCMLLLMFTYGITVNIVESAVALVAVGGAVTYILQGRPKHERKQAMVRTGVVDPFRHAALQG